MQYGLRPEDEQRHVFVQTEETGHTLCVIVVRPAGDLRAQIVGKVF